VIGSPGPVPPANPAAHPSLPECRNSGADYANTKVGGNTILTPLIPNHRVPQLAREHGADELSRTFKPWSHVVSLICAQLTQALGLNDAPTVPTQRTPGMREGPPRSTGASSLGDPRRAPPRPLS
jgi:hypothetical protein